MRLLLIGLLLPLKLLAAELQSFTLEYEVARDAMVLGRTSMNLKISGDNYSFSSSTKASGMAALLSGDNIEEQSQGRLLAGGGVAPISYSYQHSQGKKTKANTRISFAKGQASIERHKKEPRNLAIDGQTQDQLSAQLLMMRSAQHAWLKLNILDGKKVQAYEYRLKGQEEISTPAGRFKALHLERRETGKPNRYDIWIKAGANPVPLLIQQQEKQGEAVYSLRLVTKP